MEKLIGRSIEKKIIDDAMGSPAAELITLFGRRRVGKTFLVRSYLQKQLIFEFTGMRDAKLKEQLEAFYIAITKVTGEDKLYRQPENWQEAFRLLTAYIESGRRSHKAVIFLDEFPWLNSHKSGFLQAFDHWWNSWGNTQPDLVVIICGSAASWMIEHIVNNKGGLHNRITRKIRLLPFNLQETGEFLTENKVTVDRYQLLQLYMAIGGIPHYLKAIHKGESATQAIDRICFTKDGLLQGEFKNLYHSLFDDAARHLAVVRVLAGKQSGLTRAEIIMAAGLSSGGTVTQVLEELMESGFITPWQPYDRKSKDIIYKLSDEFTHFYLKFMENNRSYGEGVWQSLSTTQSYKSWNGIAFERVCLKHIHQLKKALGLISIRTEESAWRHHPAQGQGTQIDLLIDRTDSVINICEMKYANEVFIIDKAYAENLERKQAVFKDVTSAKKSLFIAMITTFGIKDNEYAARLVQNSVTMDALFE